jgi:hypothetical protein
MQAYLKPQSKTDLICITKRDKLFLCSNVNFVRLARGKTLCLNPLLIRVIRVLAFNQILFRCG